MRQKIFNKLNKLNKLKLTTATLLVFGLAMFVFDCECEIEEVPVISSKSSAGGTNSSSAGGGGSSVASSSSISIGTNDLIQIVNSNYLPVFYDTNDFSNYQILSNLVDYEGYVLDKIHYTLIVEEGEENISNFESFSTNTNYYFTNVLMTNTIFSSTTNQTFQTVGDDFRVTEQVQQYELISDTTTVGYSNYSQVTDIRNNPVGEFALRNDVFPLHANNDNSRAMTVYSNKFYITDPRDDKVYIYSNTGDYLSDFDLDTDNVNAVGIVDYSNKFYITDNNRDKVYIYDNTGAYLSNFTLHADNVNPQGIMVYSNQFYIIEQNQRKVYIYNNRGGYESNFTPLNSGGNTIAAGGIAVYSNKFYIVDLGRKIHIYDNRGTYETTFNVNSASPSGITVYSNRIYLSGTGGGQLEIYSLTGEAVINSSPQGITAYNDKLYIIDSDSERVYIYDNTGEYENRFDLHNNNINSRGITVYSNKFYIIESGTPDRVYTYNSAGTYESDFSLNVGNNTPLGIIAYNNNFYIINSGINAALSGNALLTRRVYLYNNMGAYQSYSDLSLANRAPTGIVAYNNKFYVIDEDDNRVYIYNISGTTSQGTFNLHSDNTSARGIEILNGKFYITDNNDDKVYIYPITID